MHSMEFDANVFDKKIILRIRLRFKVTSDSRCINSKKVAKY